MVCLLTMAGAASAHEWTPTYPKLKTSYEPGILQVDMKLFNKREDVTYYTFEVLDDQFEPVKYATTRRIVQVDYLGKKDIKIFIREQDKERARYICSRSKLVKEDATASLVSSRICSKIK